MSHFSAALRRLRQQANLTQDEFAGSRFAPNNIKAHQFAPKIM